MAKRPPHCNVIVRRAASSGRPPAAARPQTGRFAQIGERLGLGKAPFAASLAFKEVVRACRSIKAWITVPWLKLRNSGRMWEVKTSITAVMPMKTVLV